MRSLEEMLRQDLGLGEGDKLSPRAEAGLPASPVGYGDGAVATRAPVNDVLAFAQLQPLETAPPANDRREGDPLPFQVGRDMADPRIVDIRYEAGTSRAVRGKVVREEGRVVLDGRADTAAAQLVLASGEFVVAVHEHRFQVLEVARAEGARWGALEEWQPDIGRDALRDLPFAAWMTGWKYPSWLWDTMQDLASADSVVARAACIGLAGRLWEPADAASRDVIVKRPEDDPNARIVRFLGALKEEVLNRLEPLACTHAMALLEDLESLEALGAGGDERWIPATRELAYRRDDLESVFFVLVQRQRGKALGVALAQVDHAVTCDWSALPAKGSLEGDARLEAVALVEPDAWWGWFAGG